MSDSNAMIDMLQQSLRSQYEAALCTLQRCIELCPSALWEVPVASHPFCRVVFHTLFFTDWYLGDGELSTLREQEFHRGHSDYFRDYEELEDRASVLLYDKPTTLNYLNHCRDRAGECLRRETTASFAAPAGFPRRTCTRAELHTYVIRHVQHHAAQLSLRLRLNAGIEIPWIDHGWRDG